MSKRANEKVEKIRKKLDENVEIVSSRCKNGVASKKFLAGRKRLFALLTDHPHFQKRLKAIRKKYLIPESGFDDHSKAFEWEHKSTNRYHRYVKDIDLLVSDFHISKVFRGSVLQFVYDFALIPKRSQHDTIVDYPTFSIVRTDEDRDVNKYLINPNGLYIELFEWTTKRDIEKALKKLTTLKKDVKPFHISKVGEIARQVWLLSQQGLTDKEISKQIRESTEKKDFGYNDVPVYRKRYKDVLDTLRKI